MKFKAYLKGKKQLPTKIVTKTWGWGWFEWSNNSTMAKVTVEVKNGVKVSAAHLQFCSQNCSGPVVVTVFDFTSDVEEPAYLNGSFSADVMINMTDYPGLVELVTFGNAYINVLTEAYPSGEIRGQLKDTTPPPQTFLSVASGISELSIFASAVRAAPEIVEPARDPSTVATIFAPNNAAFEAAAATLDISLEDLLADTQLLTSILAYHIHAGAALLASQAPPAPGTDISTLLPDPRDETKQLTLHIEAKIFGAMWQTVMVNDANVLRANIRVQNGTGVIHIIDKVLIPPGFGPETLVSVASEIPELSTFVTAVNSSGLILGPASDPFFRATVFAPNNLAWQRAAAELGMTLEELLGNEPLLTAILAFHIHVDEVILASQVPPAPGIDIKTLITSSRLRIETVETNFGSLVRINNQATIDPTNPDIDVNFGTGVIHIIDSVLFPPQATAIALALRG